MFLVNEKPGNGARASIDILVVAPCCKVDVPIVQLHIYIANRMGKVPSNIDAFGMRVLCDCLDVKVLAGVVLDTGKENQSCRIDVGVDGGDDLGSGEGVRGIQMFNDNHAFSRFEAVVADLGFDCVLIQEVSG